MGSQMCCAKTAENKDVLPTISQDPKARKKRQKDFKR